MFQQNHEPTPMSAEDRRSEDHTDTAVSKNFTKRDQTSVGFLQAATDFVIHDSSFTSVGGDSFTARRDINVTINHHHHSSSSSPTPCPDPSLDLTSGVPYNDLHENRLPGNAQMTATSRGIGDSTTLVLPPLPVQRSCDIYRRHLATKGRGIPLWIPAPSQDLPIQYQRKGLSIGDVGIIMASGSFMFLFNICLPKDHPINPPVMPKDFEPLNRETMQVFRISVQREFQENSYLASAESIRARRNEDFTGLIFESSEHDGAILTMPVGSKSEDLGNKKRFRQYVTENLKSWYHYAYHDLDFEVQNGDLRVVTGIDKTSAWGMAAFFNLGAGFSGPDSGSDLRRDHAALGGEGQPKLHLEFGLIKNGSGGSASGDGRMKKYGWECSGVAEVRAGPDAREILELRGGDVEEGDVVYENQCLFVRTLNATLPEKVWQELGFEEGEDESHQNSNSGGVDGKNQDFRSSSSSSGGGGNAGGGNSHGTISSSSVSKARLSARKLITRKDIMVDGYDGASDYSSLMSMADHPSTVINAYLLKNCSDEINVAVTVDQDWISVLREDDSILPSADELLKRITATFTIREEDGVVFLGSTFVDEGEHVSSNSSIVHMNETPAAQDESVVRGQSDTVGPSAFSGLDLNERIIALRRRMADANRPRDRSGRGRKQVSQANHPNLLSNPTQPTPSPIDVSSNPPVTTRTPSKLFKPETGSTAVRRTAEPKSIPDRAGGSYANVSRTAASGTVSHRGERVNAARQLFGHRKDDPVHSPVEVHPQITKHEWPTPTRKSSSDHASGSSTSSYASSSTFTSSSSTYESESSASSLFDAPRSRHGLGTDDSGREIFTAQLKKLYRTIINLETKIKQEELADEPDSGVNTDVMPIEREVENEEQEEEKWKKRIMDHKELAELMHTLLQMSLAPSVPASLRNIPTKYNIIVRLWTNAFHGLFESLCRASVSSPIALEHLHEFIYYSYTFYACLLENPSLDSYTSGWLEALGDLARYRMVIPPITNGVTGEQGNLTTEALSGDPKVASTNTVDDDTGIATFGSHKSVNDAPAARIDSSPSSSISVAAARLLDLEPEKEQWRNVARGWYSAGSAQQPGTGKFHHHLGLVSREVDGEELRSVYHFVKGMTAQHPFPTSRESILPIWSNTAQARRSVPDARATDLFVFLHGTLFTNTQLDDFKPTLARLIERLEIEGAKEHEWIMMAVINVSAILEYGKPSGVLRKTGYFGPKQVTSLQVAAAMRAMAMEATIKNAPGATSSPLVVVDEEKADVDEEEKVETAMKPPTMPSAEVQESLPELPAALKYAMEITFAMLSHILQRLTCKPSQYAQSNLNPYLTILLTFLSTVLRHRSALDIIERSVPWEDLAAFFSTIPSRFMILRAQGQTSTLPRPESLRTNAEQWVVLTGDCSPPLNEDWCLRGMEWVGRRVYERGFFKSGEGQKNEFEALEMVESTEGVDGTVEDSDGDEGALHEGSSHPSESRRWVRIVNCGVAISSAVEGFGWNDGTADWRVEGKLAEKVESWKEENKIERVEEEG